MVANLARGLTVGTSIAASFKDRARGHIVMRLIGEPIQNADGTWRLYGNRWVYAKRAFAKAASWATVPSYRMIEWTG